MSEKIGENTLGSKRNGNTSRHNQRCKECDLNGAGRGDEPERLVFAMSELPLWKKLKGVHFGKPEDQPLILALLIVLIGLSLWLLI